VSGLRKADVTVSEQAVSVKGPGSFQPDIQGKMVQAKERLDVRFRARLFRRSGFPAWTFQVASGLEKAESYVSGLGCFRGQLSSLDFIGPVWLEGLGRTLRSRLFP